MDPTAFFLSLAFARLLLLLPVAPATPVAGTLVVAGGGRLPEEIRARFLAAAGGEQARIVVIPTASANADADPERALDAWRAVPLVSLHVLHTRRPMEADDPTFSAPLDEATGVWISGGSQTRLLEAYGGTRVERALEALLARGGAIGGTSAGAACLSGIMIANGDRVPHLRRGFDLFPRAIVDQHFLARDRLQRLVAAVHAHPARLGWGIDEGTALVVHGRHLEIVGTSYALLYRAPPHPGASPTIRVLRPGRRIDWFALLPDA